MFKKAYSAIEKKINKYRYKLMACRVLKVEMRHEEIQADGYYSQYGQDKWIAEEFFSGKENGTFVDVGAHDGVIFSNTYFLEKAGWNGVAIEPIKEIYEKLVQNRKCVVINGCISAKTGKENFRVISGQSAMLSGLVSEYDPKHLKRIQKEIKSHGGSIEDIEIKSYNFNDLLEDLNIFEVDYVNIDTEGAEYKILSNIDFDRTHISVLSVENNYSDYRIPKLMAQNGFELCAIVGDDDIYRNKKCSAFKG